jgi:hypothetical protein
MNIDPLLGLFLSLPIGVASGLYSSLIVSKIARFSALRSECLRVIRGISFIGESQNIVVLGKENVAQLPLIAGEMRHLGHKKAGAIASELYSSILGCNIAAEYGKISVEDYGRNFALWQEKSREMSASLWQLYWPFSRL